MELYLLTTILLVLMDSGIMKIEARFDISARSVITENSIDDDTCHKQSVLLDHDELNETCGMLHPEQQLKTRIINGHEAEPGQFPFAVKISNTTNGANLCGGSIISNKYILTAAHCITKYRTRTLRNVDELRIEVGAHFYNISNRNEDCRIEHKAKAFHIHHSYSILGHNNDIGIIELEEPIKFQYNQGGYGSRGPICLAKGDDEDVVKVGEELSVAGWGRTSVLNHHPNMLNFDTYRVLDKSNCSKSHDNEICLKESNVYKSSYRGDSGSALFKKIDNQFYIQVGLVSRPDWCSNVYPKDKPKKHIEICFDTIYTRVDSHLKWIELIIGHELIMLSQ